MRRLGQLALMAVLVGIAPVAMRAQGIDPFTRALSGFDAAARFSIEAILDSARAAGLPVKGLRSIVLEGIAKKADNKKIIGALERRLYCLREARSALGPISDEDLEAGASVLNAGVKADQLTPFRNAPKNRPLAPALIVLGDLVTRGVPREDASSAIVKLWQRGAGEAEFMGLFRGVESDILSGLNPGAALQNQIRESPGRAPPPNKSTSPEPESPNP